MSLERGPLSLVSTTEELLEGKSSGSDPETRECRSRDLSRWPRGTPLSAKFGTNFADKRRLVGIVLSLTQATEFLGLRHVRSMVSFAVYLKPIFLGHERK
jgi:hypothetical protein